MTDAAYRAALREWARGWVNGHRYARDGDTVPENAVIVDVVIEFKGTEWRDYSCQVDARLEIAIEWEHDGVRHTTIAHEEDATLDAPWAPTYGMTRLLLELFAIEDRD